VLPVERAEQVDRFEDGSLGWWGVQPSHVDGRALPDQFVLHELLDLDLESEEQVVDFVREWGALARRTDPFGRHGRADVAIPWRDAAGDLHDALPDPPMAVRAGAPQWNHLVHVRQHLRAMRSMVRHWINLRDGLPVADAWPNGEAGMLNGPEADFAQAITFGLEPFRARVEFRFFGGDFSWPGPSPDLYSGMCLQLFNLMVEDQRRTRAETDRP
jgi:hypothetical protein